MGAQQIPLRGTDGLVGSCCIGVQKRVRRNSAGLHEIMVGFEDYTSYPAWPIDRSPSRRKAMLLWYLPSIHVLIHSEHTTRAEQTT